ncbi:MAG: hypothetical protein QXL33_03425 [Sulfolobaceae archaeon]
MDASKLGFNRLIRRKYEECELYIASKGNDEYLIILFKENEGKESGYYYFKVMKAEAIEWNCTSILYYPYGLFGFARSKEELISKINEKIQRL